MEENKRTCLYNKHVALGALISPFGGFDMPIQYSDIKDEHEAVRNACGVFDVSHMGEVTVKGPSARSIQIDLSPFTLVGATTRSGLLTAPLRARFGINLHLEYYDVATLTKIVLRSADILRVPIVVEAAGEIAGRSRGTPRIANALPGTSG